MAAILLCCKCITAPEEQSILLHGSYITVLQVYYRAGRAHCTNTTGGQLLRRPGAATCCADLDCPSRSTVRVDPSRVGAPQEAGCFGGPAQQHAGPILPCRKSTAQTSSTARIEQCCNIPAQRAGTVGQACCCAASTLPRSKGRVQPPTPPAACRVAVFRSRFTFFPSWFNRFSRSYLFMVLRRRRRPPAALLPFGTARIALGAATRSRHRNEAGAQDRSCGPAQQLREETHEEKRRDGSGSVGRAGGGGCCTGPVCAAKPLHETALLQRSSVTGPTRTCLTAPQRSGCTRPRCWKRGPRRARASPRRRRCAPLHKTALLRRGSATARRIVLLHNAARGCTVDRLGQSTDSDSAVALRHSVPCP